MTKQELFDLHNIDEKYSKIQHYDYFHFEIIFNIVHLSPFVEKDFDSYLFLIDFLVGNPDNLPLLNELTESAKRLIYQNNKDILQEINNITEGDEPFSF